MQRNETSAMRTATGRQERVTCQGSDEQKKPHSQQKKDRLIIVGTSEPHSVDIL